MATDFKLSAQMRTDVGKGASRRLRRQANLIPAIIYGAGKSPTMITIDHDSMLHALENEAFFSHILEIKLGEQIEQVILKDLQRHPYKPKILHADFQRIKADEKLTLSVPLHFIGEHIAPGVKEQGGKVSHYINELEIRCLPAKLPEFIEVDISRMQLNDIIHMRDLTVPADIEVVALIHDPDNNSAIVGVHAAKVKAEPEAEEEAVETEITTEKKEEAENNNKKAE